MKQLLAALLLSLYASVSLAAIAVSQQNSGVGYNPASFTITLPSLPTTGDGIVITLCFRGGAQTGMTVVDNEGNTYTQVSVSTLTGVSDAEIWWAPHIGASTGTFTVTVTPISYSNYAVGILDVAGLSTTVDKTSANTTSGGTTTPSVTASAANSNANDLVVAAWCDHAQPAPRTLSHPASTGYTDVAFYDLTSPNNYGTSDSGFKIVSAVETSSAAWTTAASDNGAGTLATFEASSGGSSCTHNAYTHAGTIAVPTAGSTVVYRQDGTESTVNCTSNNYWQPSSGTFGAN